MLELTELQITLLQSLGGIVATISILTIAGVVLYKGIKRVPTEYIERFL
jgi:hypothetical protein